MKIHLSPTLKQAIARELTMAADTNAILDVYGTATKVQAAHPEENVAWEDIVQALLAGRGNLQAIEFTERIPEVVEIVLHEPEPGDAPAEERILARAS